MKIIEIDKSNQTVVANYFSTIKFIQNGDLENTKLAVEQYNVQINGVGTWFISLDNPAIKNDTLLAVAVFNNQEAIVDYLLQKGSDPDWAIRAACSGKNINLVKHLVESGADPTNGISSAAATGNIEVVKYLLECGADINGENLINTDPPIVFASLNGYVDIVHLLVAGGADVNKIGCGGNTAMRGVFFNLDFTEKSGSASHDTYINIAQYLIENGANKIGFEKDIEKYITTSSYNDTSDTVEFSGSVANLEEE
jgi:hypothetical protein